MPSKVERILFKVGEGSLAVTLPKPWVVYNHLKPGDTVEVITDDGVLIRVKAKPEPVKFTLARDCAICLPNRKETENERHIREK